MVPNLNKICRICLSLGSRSIFTENGSTNSSNEPNDRTDVMKKSDAMSLEKIAAKLRFVTLMKVKENENLPNLICDLCIVQLNVAYNFKRLALENDFRLRQYLIENGMSVEKDHMEEPQPTANQTTSLQIHHQQIDVIVDRSQATRFREPDPPNRRNSAVSTASSCFNNRDNSNTPSSTVQEVTNRFILPKPMIRPIQIKVEPEDPVEEEAEVQVQASPASSSSGMRSHISIMTDKSPPMVQIPIQPVVEIQSSPESAKNKETELDDSETTESYSGNTPEVPPRRLPPSLPSTNESIESNPPPLPQKKPSSPSVMETRKKKDEQPKKSKGKDALHRVRGLRPIQRKSLNEIKMRQENAKDGEKILMSAKKVKKQVETITKANAVNNNDKKSKKKILENFLKNVVSSSLKFKKKEAFKIKVKPAVKGKNKKDKDKKNKKGEKTKKTVRGKKNEIVAKRKYVKKEQGSKKVKNISKGGE